MGLSFSGMDVALENSVVIKTTVKTSHPVMTLMNVLDWKALANLVESDLKNTTAKKKWKIGRKLKARIHLGAYLIQQMLNLTDRATERLIRDTPVYSVFCGKTFVKGWHVPDHTKIAEFRARLSPETHCQLANIIATHACKKGFASAAHVDIDSTVQKPDMQFPATVNLLTKAASVGRRIQKLLFKKFPKTVKDKVPDINMKEIKGIAKEHNFEKRKDLKKRQESRKAALTKLWGKVSEAIQPVIRFGRMLTEPFIFESLNKREQNDVSSFITQALALLTDVYEHCYDNTKCRANVYSFNRKEVSLFNKDKHHKGVEYGRQFQIARIEGNFLFSIPNDSLRMPDAESFKKMLKGHIETFQTPIESITTDKGYYSKANEQLALDFGIKKVGVQRPNHPFVGIYVDFRL